MRRVELTSSTCVWHLWCLFDKKARRDDGACEGYTRGSKSRIKVLRHDGANCELMTTIPATKLD